MKNIIKLICLLLTVAMLLPLAACKGKNIDDGPSWQPNIDGEGGQFVPTVGMLVFYIFDCSYSFTDEEYEEHGFDESASSLKKIKYDDEHTWYDELLRRAKESTELIITYCNAAIAAGLEITEEDKQSVENTLVQQRTQAAIYGYEFNEYLKLYYGCDYITEDVLREIYEMQLLADKYCLQLDEEFRAAVTDEAIAAKIKADGLTDTSKTKNIAVILFPVDDFGEEAKSLAEARLKSYEGKTPDKDTFMDVSDIESAHSEYYENVYKGKMLAEINEWIFSDDPPKVGDMTVIEVAYGQTVVYYESDGIGINESQAKDRIVDDMFDEWFEAAKEKFNSPVTDKMIDSVDLDI